MTTSQNINSEQPEMRDWQRRLIEQEIKHSIPKLYADATPQGAQIVEFARNIASNIENGKGLFITGDVGTGKTYSACSIAIAAIKQNLPAKYLTGGDLIRHLTGAITAGSSEELIIEELSEHRLLIIDDLGREGMTAKTLSRLFDVINDRKNKLLSTIYTTNYNEQGLIKKWAETGDAETAKAIMSRIIDKKRTEKIVMIGEDRRLS